MMRKNKEKKNLGFTLVELLVSITLISIFTTTLIAAFVVILQAQVVAQEQREGLESIRFMLADIQREAYFGSDYLIEGGNCLIFNDQLNRRIKIRLNSFGVVEKSVKVIDPEPNTCLASDAWSPLTGDAVHVDSLEFSLPEDSDTQPQLKLKTSARYFVKDAEYEIALQTLITSRILEPDQSIATSFSSGFDAPDPNLVRYFFFNNDGECVDNTGSSEGYEDRLCSRNPPLITEFIGDNLGILDFSGLLFKLPSSNATAIFGVTGVDAEEQNSNFGNSALQPNTVSEAITLVKKDDEDAVGGLTALHGGDSETAFVFSNTGELFKVDLRNNATSPIESLLDRGGGEKVFKLSYNDSKILLYHDIDRNGLHLLSSDDLSKTGSNSIKTRCNDPLDNLCQYPVTGIGNCYEIFPAVEYDCDNDPNSVNPFEENLRTISRIENFQLLDDAIFIWYSSGSAKKVLLIKDAASRIFANADYFKHTNIVDLGTKYVFICKDGKNICSVSKSGITDTSNPAAIASKFSSSEETDREDNEKKFQELSKLDDNLAIGVDERGRLFSVSTSIDVEEDLLVSRHKEEDSTICDRIDDEGQQVDFYYLGKRSKDGVLPALGRSTDTQGDSHSDIYFIQGSDDSDYRPTKCEATEEDASHLGRYALAGDNLWLIHLRDVVAKLVKPESED